MALMPSGYLKAVVPLGTQQGSFTHGGTGFLYNHPVQQLEGQTSYLAFLVTNRHVIEGHEVTHVRFNRIRDGSLEVQSISSVTSADWILNANGADIAVRPIVWQSPLGVGRDVVKPEIFLGDVGTPSTGEWANIMEGNGVFVIGFPLGLTGKTRTYPIVRQGIVSRIQDWGLTEMRARFLSMLQRFLVIAEDQ